MAITRAQQARQMLKAAGAVEQDGVLNYIKNSDSVTVPKEFKARKNAPATKLAYITDAEAKMLKKEKPGTPHKGPKGIPSYDSFDADRSFTSGAAMSAAETGSRDPRDRAEVRAAFGPKGLAPGVTPNEVRDLRSAAIAAGAGQRVNPGFFDSRNVISPAELAAAKAFAKDRDNRFAGRAMRKTRDGGLFGFLRSGGILGNLIRGLGRGLGLGKRFNQPTYDMSQFNKLGLGGVDPFANLDIRDKFDRRVDDEEDDVITDNDMSLVPEDRTGLLETPGIPIPDNRGLLEVPGIPITPFQEDIILETPKDQADDSFLKDAMAKLNTKETLLFNNLNKKELMFDAGIGEELTPEEKQQLQELKEKKESSLINRALVADGGYMGGGIMDAAGRQQYFLGKLVKKATRAVKKIVKSPVGKLGLLAAATVPFGGFAAKSPLMNFLFKEGTLGSGLTGKGMLSLGGALTLAPLLFGQQQEEQPSGFTGSVGGEIDQRAYTDPYGLLFGAFKAEGGSMKDEPVAKRTMPLLDMGGQEMDLRAKGGFVPIGRMEKADDVPARLSKNEFVFTADAVRNAGDGDVDKGAEVMYNMMKNLEAGGEVSEESQGREGARKMFQTSQRLEEVL